MENDGATRCLRRRATPFGIVFSALGLRQFRAMKKEKDNGSMIMNAVDAEERRPRVVLPLYTLSEEIVNAITHGIGTLLAIAALVLLIVRSATRAPAGQTAGYVVGYTIFGVTLVTLYLFSTLYHSLARCGAKRVFASLDHAAIFLLIAGTYSAFCLGPISGGQGWWVFGTIWALAIIGIVSFSVYAYKAARFNLFLYLAMGWYAVLVAPQLWDAVPVQSWVFLLLGGVLYTIGCVFFVLHRVRWFHSVWHLFVLAGSIMHFFALYWAI